MAPGILATLGRSRVFRDYQRAFTAATGLALTLRPPSSLYRPSDDGDGAGCALLAKSDAKCPGCGHWNGHLGRGVAPGANGSRCRVGLGNTTVAIRTGDRVLGFLHTNPIGFERPTREKFAALTEHLAGDGTGWNGDLRRLKDIYLRSRVVSRRQYAGIVQLLEIFAHHLELLSNQLLIEQATRESPFCQRVKAYVEKNLQEQISLKDAADALHVSTFYFCKLFKKSMGITFTDYVGRLRIERAKSLLLDPHKRVSEIAYEVGFGSLTHFNRLFRKVVGQSPSDYRRKTRRTAAR